MAFFDVEKLKPFADEIRQSKRHRYKTRSLKNSYCGNCGKERECIYLFYRDVPREFVGTRICMTCGYAPGQNVGVPDKKVRAVVLEADNYECVYCGATEHLVLDHIVPHSHGGAAEAANLLTACRTCNGRRRTGRTMPLRFGRFRK